MIADRIKFWLRDHALPLWAGAGTDRVQGGFIERLRPDGSPDFAADKRSMVQARQIYVYSHAAMLGFGGKNVETADRGFDFLLRYASPDGMKRGVVHALGRAGDVRDALRDTYDQAFCLMAFSWYYRASGNPAALRAIEEISAAIELLRHPSGLGYVEAASERLPRRQNPHMHLFEAFLAAYEATGQQQFLDRAAEVLVLLRGRFICDGTLREYFADDLSVAVHPYGAIVEPGHHHEWVWLLAQHERLAKTDSRELRELLHTKARRTHEADTGLAVNEIWADGSTRDAAKRLWPQTEALKAAIAVGEYDTIPSSVACIFDRFLSPAPPGSWIDRLGSDNSPLLSASIPASSFYHVFLAFACCIEVSDKAISP